MKRMRYSTGNAIGIGNAGPPVQQPVGNLMYGQFPNIYVDNLRLFDSGTTAAMPNAVEDRAKALGARENTTSSSDAGNEDDFDRGSNSDDEDYLGGSPQIKRRKHRGQHEGGNSGRQSSTSKRSLASRSRKSQREKEKRREFDEMFRELCKRIGREISQSAKAESGPGVGLNEKMAILTDTIKFISDQKSMESLHVERILSLEKKINALMGLDGENETGLMFLEGLSGSFDLSTLAPGAVTGTSSTSSTSNRHRSGSLVSSSMPLPITTSAPEFSTKTSVATTLANGAASTSDAVSSASEKSSKTSSSHAPCA